MPPAGILVDGLTTSCLYVTMAFGMVLVFSILGILNWSHGSMFMLGAFIVYYTVTAGGIPFPLSILIAAVAIGGLGILMQKFIIEPISVSVAGLGMIYVSVATIGLVFFFEGAASMFFGLQQKGMATVLPGVLTIGEFSISYQKIAVVVLTVVIMIAMYIMLNRTKVGLSIRAAAQEPVAASLYGISVGRVSLLVMGIGCALAAIAGGFMAPVYIIDPFMGRIPLVMSLLAIIIGGVGSLTGAIVGGIILGLLNSIIAYYFGYGSEIALFALVIFILLVRPQGLLGASIK